MFLAANTPTLSSHYGGPHPMSIVGWVPIPPTPIVSLQRCLRFQQLPGAQASKPRCSPSATQVRLCALLPACLPAPSAWVVRLTELESRPMPSDIGGTRRRLHRRSAWLFKRHRSDRTFGEGPEAASSRACRTCQCSLAFAARCCCPRGLALPSASSAFVRKSLTGRRIAFSSPPNGRGHIWRLIRQRVSAELRVPTPEVE